MEWVETTGKTIDEARDLALDQLGVAADEAEFEVVEEPRTGLFGRSRGEARVRARVMPTAVRPKQERRSRGKTKAKRDERSDSPGDSGTTIATADPSDEPSDTSDPSDDSAPSRGRSTSEGRSRSAGSKPRRERAPRPKEQREQHMDESNESTVTPEEVGAAAVAFMDGLTQAFGCTATTTLEIEDTSLDVRVVGQELGLMVGPGGRTLTAVQDLVRVASQRRLGDHETRLRIDVGGYREKRRVALERFATVVAAQVIESGDAKALEPMSSADRKTVHDTIVGIDGVSSQSDGEDPTRRVVITPE